MREKNRKSIASYIKFPQFTTMNVIDGQAGLVFYSSLFFYSLTIDNILNIIVLLILAGVTIAALTGSDSAPSKANEAKQKNDIGAAKDDVSLTATNALTEAYEAAYVETGVSAGDASTTVGTYVRNKLNRKYGTDGNFKTGLATITATAGGYSSTIEVAVIEEQLDKISTKKSTAANTTFVALSTSGTTTLKDEVGNKVKVPKNFRIHYDSGIYVQDGVVIEDENGNQFVWVPVGTIKKANETSVTIPLGRYSTFTGTPSPVQGLTETGGYTTTTSSHVISGYYYEFKDDTESTTVKNATYDNTKANNIQEFVESANRNGGYYIARYEAGISGTTDQATLAGFHWNDTFTAMEPTDTSKVVDTDGNVKPIIKSGQGVWNVVTQPQAATICQSMYTSGVTSDLMNSYAWNTAITFIQT